MRIPVRVRSHYSLGVGTVSPERLAQRARAAGLSALALSDVGTFAGQVEFHAACRANGLMPLTGVELFARVEASSGATGERFPFVALARNRRGYEILCRAITLHAAGEPVDDVVHDGVADLLLLSDSALLLGEFRRRGVPSDALCALLVPDATFAVERREDRAEALLLHAIESGEATSPQALASAERRESACARAGERTDHRKADERASERLLDVCDFDLLAAPPPDPTHAAREQRAFARIAEHCRRRCPAQPGYARRLEDELGVIRHLGLGYQLEIVLEIAEEARRRGVSMTTRGSAVGSLAVHLLGISDVDPIRHGLVFERFARPGRSGAPDVDLDIASDRRDALVEWALRRFRDGTVALVSAYHRYQRRAAYREGLRALGMSLTEATRFSSLIPEDPELPMDRASLPAAYRAASAVIERLVGKPRHVAAHPGGIVVADGDVQRWSPLRPAPKGPRVTDYDAESLSRLGLSKIDLLGNRCLAELDAIARLTGHLVVDDFDDAATLATVRSAGTVGCFELESPLMRQTLRRLPIRTIEDMVAALALVRPAPASNDARSAFVRRAHGEEPARAPHPRLTAVLRETLGLVLYEEDVLRVVQTVAGTSLAEADAFRAAIVEGKDRWPDFRERAAANGFSEADASSIWLDLRRFAAYSFSKAHASSHARLAYRSARAKTHEPVAFGCAVLDHHGGAYPLRSIASEIARLGVRLLPGSVNAPLGPCVPEGGAIRVGFDRLEGVARSTKRKIAAARAAAPFADLDDFTRRVSLQRRELEALVLSGACDGLEPLSEAAYPFAHHRALCLPLPGALGRSGGLGDSASHRQTYSSLVRIKNELRYWKMHLTDHPMRVLRLEADRMGASTSLAVNVATGRIRFVGILAASRKVPTRDGGLVQFLTFEDEHGLVEAVFRPPHLMDGIDPVTTPGPYIVTGVVMHDHDASHVQVDGLTPFHMRERPYETLTR